MNTRKKMHNSEIDRKQKNKTANKLTPRTATGKEERKIESLS